MVVNLYELLRALVQLQEHMIAYGFSRNMDLIELIRQENKCGSDDQKKINVVVMTKKN